MDTSESSTARRTPSGPRHGPTSPDPGRLGGPGPPRAGRRSPPGWRRWAMDTRPLRRPAYRRLWSSTIVTAVGSQLTAVAVPKQIYDITGSSAWVGYASLAGLLPLVRVRAVGRRGRRQHGPPQAAAGHQQRHRRHLACCSGSRPPPGSTRWPC